MFEVEVGPFGRAYATDSGVVYDPPVRAEDVAPLIDDRAPPIDGRGGAVVFESADVEPALVERSATDAELEAIRRISALPPPDVAGDEAVAVATDDAEVKAQRPSFRAEQKTAEAYKQAANLAQTPGGTNVSQSLDAFG